MKTNEIPSTLESLSEFQVFRVRHPDDNCGSLDYARMAFEYAFNRALKLASPAPVVEQREWRAAHDWKDDGTTTGDMGAEDLVDSWVAGEIAEPRLSTTNPRKQWRTPAGPWQDAEAKS